MRILGLHRSLLLASSALVGLCGAALGQTEAQTSPSSPTEFHFAAAQAVYLVWLEQVPSKKWDNEMRVYSQLVCPSMGMSDRCRHVDDLREQFRKEARFRIVEDPNTADFVFLAYRFGKNLKTEVQFAITPANYAAHVTWRNELRGSIDLEGLQNTALWSSVGGLITARRVAIASATLGEYAGRSSGTKERIKEFHRDILGSK